MTVNTGQSWVYVTVLNSDMTWAKDKYVLAGTDAFSPTDQYATTYRYLVAPKVYEFTVRSTSQQGPVFAGPFTNVSIGGANTIITIRAPNQIVVTGGFLAMQTPLQVNTWEFRDGKRKPVGRIRVEFRDETGEVRTFATDDQGVCRPRMPMGPYTVASYDGKFASFTKPGHTLEAAIGAESVTVHLMKGDGITVEPRGRAAGEDCAGSCEGAE